MARRDQRLRELDQALSDGAMMLSEFDGFVAGLLVCPDLIPPSEWLPKVWGVEGEEPPFSSPTHDDAIIALVMAHYNYVFDRLLRQPKRYTPILDRYEPTDEVFWEFWVEGFEAAMALRPNSWTAMAEADGEAGAAISMLLALNGLVRQDEDTELTTEQAKALAESAPALIPLCVATLAEDRYKGLIPGPTPRAKTGRNDLCPCGSGKKFKKCCGVG